MNFQRLLADQQNSEDNHQQAFEKDETGDELTPNRTRFKPTHLAALLPFNLALANLHRGLAGKPGFNIMCDLAAMEAAILNENFIGSHACNDHSSKVETGDIAFERLRITGRAAVLPLHAHTKSSQKIKVGMVPRQGKHVVVIDGNGTLGG